MADVTNFDRQTDTRHTHHTHKTVLFKNLLTYLLV